MLHSSIDNFRVSDTIVLGGINSGQTSSYKMLWSSLSYWTTTIKNCRESQTSFHNFIFRWKLLYLWAAWRSGNEKNISTWVHTWIQKNAQTTEDIFWIFTDFYGVTWVQSPTCSPLPTQNRNFVNDVANPETVYNSWTVHVLNPRLIFFWNSLITLGLCT